MSESFRRQVLYEKCNREAYWHTADYQRMFDRFIEKRTDGVGLEKLVTETAGQDQEIADLLRSASGRLTAIEKHYSSRNKYLGCALVGGISAAAFGFWIAGVGSMFGHPEVGVYAALVSGISGMYAQGWSHESKKQGKISKVFREYHGKLESLAWRRAKEPLIAFDMDVQKNTDARLKQMLLEHSPLIVGAPDVPEDPTKVN